MALGLACAAGSLVWSLAGWLSLGCLALFLLSSVSFLSYILSNDPAAAWAALPFLLLRALATGFGLLAGFLVRPRGLPRKGPGLWESSVKRLLDVAVSLVGLAVSAPAMLLSALAIRIDTPGPIFFIQVRVGENGRPFHLYKLRTMVADAEARLEEVQGQDGMLKPIRKLPSDLRVTRVGHFLRRWSLDELPQFWNVLKGEMSLVGPRPEELRVAQWYSDEDRRRLAVKPGMTGPVQVSGRADLDMPARFQLELDYIEQYTLWKDVELMARSLPAILSGKGAY
jgi:lipopolysaccharide/colanic/teichoic acid biosynthesis glycosyltransferase